MFRPIIDAIKRLFQRLRDKVHSLLVSKRDAVVDKIDEKAK